MLALSLRVVFSSIYYNGDFHTLAAVFHNIDVGHALRETPSIGRPVPRLPGTNRWTQREK